MKNKSSIATLAVILLFAGFCGAAERSLNSPPPLTATTDPDGRTAANAPAPPRIRFGIFADVQYADKETQGKRRYREALAKLRDCLEAFNQDSLDFVVNLGDLIDGNGAASLAEFDRVTARFELLKPKLYHVVGNHCLEVDRPVVMRALKLSSGYYEFHTNRWGFIVLDGMDVSLKSPPGSPELAKAREYLAGNPNLQSYNGAIGEIQLQWFKEQLAEAQTAKRTVIVFCHHPSLPAASDRALTLWNYEEVLKVMEASGRVVAFFCGHEHRGGYAEQRGIHHVTLPGIVESPAGGNGYAVVEVFDDRLSIHGTGTVPSRVLNFTVRSSASASAHPFN